MFSKSRILIFLLAAFMLAIALPVMAQDTGDDVADLETIEITISGTVEFIVAVDGTTVVTVGGSVAVGSSASAASIVCNAATAVAVTAT